MRDKVSDEQFKSRDCRFVCSITAGAWALRMFFGLLAYGGKDIVGILWPRGIEALGIAKSLLIGNGFSSPFAIPTGPTAFLPPIYPAMLAGIERVFGLASKSSAWVILGMQCAFSALTCAALYYFAIRFFDGRIARRAAWIWALFPYAVLLPTNIIWENTLSALLIIVILGLFADAFFAPTQSKWILVGIAFGISCLINAAFLLLLPALLIYAVARNACRRGPAYCLFAFMLCLSPWAVRNYVTFHKAFPLRDNFGLELWIGNHERATTGFDPEIHPAFNMNELREYQQVGEIEYMSQKTQLATGYIERHPVVFVKSTMQRILTYWLVGIRALWLLIPVLTIAGFLGLFLLLRRSDPMAWLFAIPLLVYPLPYYVTHPDIRYQHPMQPLLALLAAVAVRRTKPHEFQRESLSNA